MTDIELLDELSKRAEEYEKQKQKEFAIAALEKLRAEFHEKAEIHIDGDYYLRDAWIDEYINNYIEELNNGTL